MLKQRREKVNQDWWSTDPQVLLVPVWNQYHYSILISMNKNDKRSLDEKSKCSKNFLVPIILCSWFVGVNNEPWCFGECSFDLLGKANELIRWLWALLINVGRSILLAIKSFVEEWLTRWLLNSNFSFSFSLSRNLIYLKYDVTPARSSPFRCSSWSVRFPFFPIQHWFKKGKRWARRERRAIVSDE